MKTEAYINGIILDGSRDMVPQTGKTLIVSDGKITAIQNSTEQLPSDCKVVDLKGGYLLPGLINLHVHIPGPGEPKDKPIDAAEVIRT